MTNLFHLSKPRAVQFMILGGLFMVSLLLLGVVSSVNVGFLISAILIMTVVLFCFFKFMDYEDKQVRYEKMGYKYLTTTENGETVLTFTPTPGKMSPDAYILLAVFDTDGYITRQTRLLKKDVELAQLVLMQDKKKDKER